MDEKQENNIYKPKVGGIVLAAILLVFIVAVILIVVFVLAKDPSSGPVGTEAKNNTPVITTGGDVTGTVPGTPELTGADPGGDPIPGGVSAGEIRVDTNDIYKGELILINAEHPYQMDKEKLLSRSEMAKLSAGALLETYNFRNVYGTGGGNYLVKATTGFYLNVDTLNAFNRMMSAYVEEKGNKDVQLRNAYYYDASEEVCLNATGYMVDLEIYSQTKKATYPLKYTPMKADYYDWFVENSYKYGFIHVKDVKNSAGEEKYSSFRYVGEGNAAAMTSKGLDLAAYIELIKGYRFENRLVFTAGGTEYWAWYTPGTGLETTIRTVGNNYTLSGNNIDGFVVALNASELGG